MSALEIQENTETSSNLGAGLDEEPYKLFTTSKTAQEHSVYFSGEVVSPSAYDDLSHLIRHMATEDSIRLYLNTPGGDMEAGLALIQAMRECKGDVTTVLNVQAASMGALLFLAGRHRVAPANGLLMFHNYSGGISGKGNEQVAELSAVTAWFEEVMIDVCHPFLSRKEIRFVLNGRDLWIHGKDISHRLQEQKKAPRK